MNCCVLIPAYRPGAQLVDVVRQLAQTPLQGVVVVDDGSGSEYAPVFDAVRQLDQGKVRVLEHAVNLGKGAALKTGLNHCLCTFKDVAIVTADADGQHLVDDILGVARSVSEQPNALVLGSRQFATNGTPLRSRIGNIVTRRVMRLAAGLRLTDTQTGLRGIPASLAKKLLSLPSNRYEFELDMLLVCHQAGIAVREVPIQTVYLDGNRSSHFNPLIDSMRIYFVLLRFAMASLLTAGLDYTVFALVFAATSKIGLSQVLARLVALLFNYAAVRRAVFYSDRKHSQVFPRYLALVIVSGLISYALIHLLLGRLTGSVIWAKLVAELLVFIANFAVMREFIFAKQDET